MYGRIHTLSHILIHRIVRIVYKYIGCRKAMYIASIQYSCDVYSCIFVSIE